jgi:hypothetical protein
MTGRPDEDAPWDKDVRDTLLSAEKLEDGSLDPDELDAEPAWWDEGSDDET